MTLPTEHQQEAARTVVAAADALVERAETVVGQNHERLCVVQKSDLRTLRAALKAHAAAGFVCSRCQKADDPTTIRLMALRCDLCDVTWTGRVAVKGSPVPYDANLAGVRAKGCPSCGATGSNVLLAAPYHPPAPTAGPKTGQGLADTARLLVGRAHYVENWGGEQLLVVQKRDVESLRAALKGVGCDGSDEGQILLCLPSTDPPLHPLMLTGPCCGCGTMLQWGPSSSAKHRLCVPCAREAFGLPPLGPQQTDGSDV